METHKIVVGSNEKEYPIYIGERVFRTFPSLAKEICGGKRAAVISDTNVFPLYGERIKTLLLSAGYEVLTFVLPAGESAKNTNNLLEILSFLSSNLFDRHDVVISLGGGVVGDISGLASSLYMRGTKLVHIPTTLLACVDSCIGGKTAVNTEYGKNMIGTFHDPDFVFCDTSFLSTLPEAEHREGMAEVIKYGIIRDPELFEKVKKKNVSNKEIIVSCLEIKKEFVEKDRFDCGDRRLLNFGHTFGHAMEKLSGYTLSHGNAVSAGMVIASKVSEKLSLCTKSITEEIISVLSSYGLPTECDFALSDIFDACINDKKSSGDVISLILPVKIGGCIVKNVGKTELKGIIECI